MLNFQLVTDRDRREAAAIDRRRTLEEERKKRIFNPRQRLYGVDYEALEKQIDEKKRIHDEEQRLDRIFAEQLRKNDEIALALEKKDKEERVKLHREINDFRMCCQRPEDRREFDLNDPLHIKKQTPVRSSNEDPKCGPSSAQKFEGEDLSGTERARMQRDQVKAWLDQQMREKEAADKERKAAEAAYMEAVIARDQRAIQLDNMERGCRKRLEEACLRFNRALANEKKANDEIRKTHEHEDNLAEMYNFITSDLLTENPEISQSNLGPDKKIGYLYKGMTSEQKEEVRRIQLGQIEEAKKRRDLELRMEKEFEEYMNGTQRSVALMDRELEKKHRESQRDLAEENRRMAAEQKTRQAYLSKLVYNNNPSAEYYDQFNKTTR